MRLLLVFILSIASITAFSQGLIFEDADLQCFDGQTEIGIYYGKAPAERNYGTIEEINLNAGHEVRIHQKGKKAVVLDKNIHLVTDGAGNDTAEVLHRTGVGLTTVTRLFYDHEEGFLRGFYSLPQMLKNPRNSEHIFFAGFSDKIFLEVGKMNCHDYTYGDK